LTAVTVSAWVKLDDTGSTHAIIARHDTGTNNRSIFLLYSAGGGGFGLSIDGDGTGSGQFGVAYDTIVGVPTVGQTYHVVGTFDGSNIRIYVDAVLGGTTARSGGIHDANVITGVGAASNITSLMDGSITLPKIYNRALSQAEITESYNGGVPICTADLSTGLKAGLIYAPRLANWDTNAGQELVDQSTGNITTTNVGSTPYTGSGLTVSCS